MIFDLEQDEGPPPRVANPSETSSEGSVLSWLPYYARRGLYDDTAPAYRTIASWVSTTPDEYFELLKEPARPQQSHRANASVIEQQAAVPLDVDNEIRLMAWNIWAHWLVFAILVEHETFWIPNLGVPGINSLSPLFQGSGSAPAEGEWWPGTMCTVALQLQKYHNPLRSNQSNMT